jgi:phosphatidylserine/phosphatidylglycerophosphate/cardiolipin synthase-like enzyme
MMDGDEILETLKTVIDNANESIIITQYQFDHRVICGKLCDKVPEGVDVRLILDEGKFEYRSCAGHADRQMEYFESGGGFWTHRPSKGGWASMHFKSLAADRRVLVTGSLNLTHNSIEKNVEQVVRLTGERTLMKHCAFFEQLWEKSKPVTREDVERALNKKRDAKEKQSKKKPESSQPSSSSQSTPTRGPTSRGPGIGT